MLTKLSLLSLGLTVALVAADFWTKPSAEWTEKEVNQMVQDSPWADRMSVETGQRGAIGNADDKGGPMQGNLTTPIVVVWRTAQPVREAFAQLTKTPVNAADPAVSVLMVSLIPGSFRGDVADIAKLTADTVIKVKGKADLHPTEIQMPEGAAPQAAPGGGKGKGKGFGGGAPFDLLYVFPKDAGVTADDKEMEFVTKIGKMTVRKKFKMKDMMYNGKLEI